MDLSQKPKDYSILFLDMNSYFASVEQQVRPSLQGVPVAITPYTGSTGCVIAKSVEAKKYGIKTGDLVRDAREKCPKIKVVEARPDLYQFYHREIVAVLKKNSPYVEPLSIDEFIIRLTGQDRSFFGAKKMAQNIKKDLKESAGEVLTCSIGVGPNYFLAKVAGESKKPDGLTFVTLPGLKGFYKKFNLKDLPGINFRMERQLAKRQIYTVLDLYEKTLYEMSRYFGHNGKVWYYRLRGYEVDSFESKTKTCGHSHVLEPSFRSKKGALRVLEKLVHKTAYRLRDEHLWARGISVSMKFMEGGRASDFTRLDMTSETKVLMRAAKDIFLRWRFAKTPLRLSVTTFDLVQTKHEQKSIFKEVEESRRVSKVMDKINDKYGEGTVLYGEMFGTERAAPDRIPFGKPRYDIRNF